MFMDRQKKDAKHIEQDLDIWTYLDPSGQSDHFGISARDYW